MRGNPPHRMDTHPLHPVTGLLFFVSILFDRYALMRFLEIASRRLEVRLRFRSFGFVSFVSSPYRRARSLLKRVAHGTGTGHVLFQIGHYRMALFDCHHYRMHSVSPFVCNLCLYFYYII